MANGQLIEIDLGRDVSITFSTSCSKFNQPESLTGSRNQWQHEAILTSAVG